MLDTSLFLRKRRGVKALEKAARVVASLGLLVGLLGPMPLSPLGEPTRTAEAKNLEWSNVRPPMTTEADADDTNGFTHLPDLGTTVHAVVVAPNGDLFVAGTGADVNAGGAAACGDVPTDFDADGDGTCDAAATAQPAVFKSVNGGKSWRAAIVLGAGAGTTIRQIVVSPDYPSDDFVAVVFTPATAAPATTGNGIAWSIDAGLTFPAAQSITGAGVDPDMADVNWRTIALSPDFNYNDGNGELAIGGMAATAASGPTTATILTTALKAALAATTVNDITEGTATSATTDGTLDLSYTYDEEPIALARLYVDGDGGKTYGQIRGAGWGVVSASEEIKDDDTTSFVATSGSVAFDDDYATGGSFFAGAGAGGTVGGVFRFSGTAWAEKTLTRPNCDASVDSIAVAGNGTSTRILASLSASNLVCRSLNEGSGWSDTNADGGDNVCDQCRVTATGAITRIANSRKAPEVVYWTSSGALGGVMRSGDTGSSWSDTGLTNEPFVVTGMTEIDANKAFASASSGTNRALFYTDNYGTGAGWKRVLRYAGTDFNLIDFSSDFATSGIGYAYRSAVSTDVMIKTTNGGMTWDKFGADPFANGPDSNEVVVTSSQRSATKLYLGGDKGHVAVTEDGGNSWTLLAKDFGDRIDEFDFTSDPTTFFVTALDTDTTLKVWQTRDGGATFTQVGDAPWGTGNGLISTLITGYKPADNSGYIVVQTGTGTAGAVSNMKVYRMKIGDSTWSAWDKNQDWDGVLMTSTPGTGDGVMMTLWDNDAAPADALYTTFVPFTGDLLEFDPDNAADTERKNLLNNLPAPPVYTGTSTLGTARTLPGYTLQVTAGGRVQELTLTSQYTGGVKLTTPANNTSIPTNVGDNGIPAVFRWEEVPSADTYDLMIGLNPKLSDGVIIAGIGQNLQAVTPTAPAPGMSLIQGNTYYWAVRVASARGVGFEGPWSAISSFSVASQGAPLEPKPQLPADNSTMPNLGPIQLSWNNPAGTVQFHIQVLPLNNDGPAIDLIIGDPAQVASASYTIMPPVLGQGNYIMLPGATYNWRVRTTTQTGSISTTDSSWGPWSEIRTFKTPRPSAATIQLQPVTPSATPTLSWKDSNVNNFYYEVQLSQDRTFNADPATATAAVYWNLVHGGLTNPLNSWTVPSGVTLEKGKTYYWRVRQRVQATPLGADEPGIGWSATASFVVP